MKRLLLLSFIGLFAQLMISCYPGGADDVDEMDVAITNYDKSADFTKYTTFSLPDTIVYFVAKGETPNHKFDAQILDLVKKNFEDKGYTYMEQTEINQPSFIVTVSAFSNVNYYYGANYWYDYWGWYPGWNWIWGSGWGPGWGPSYPWYPVAVYSYRSGSIVIDMIATDATTTSTKKVPVLWSGVADGILQGSEQSILNRMTSTINQCFTQSPYLKSGNAQ
ncbi:MULTISPECIES: DUF4136 domain-containing protein [Porphyromonadaceae]|uniref:DUF4136 domain-containing protein n=1 Tax=Sanguibacteroides justesenii TaxID=1547597 RepID=A0A0C3R7A5_9PORP|nr:MULTISPECIES: DUF4136 domain-containing protein [Porphyromonadaceae]KIO46045.1 hypothetical protein BA92_02955 [Sanguibacteroides justesenii]KIO47415.1 hypothetical protein IE90_00120 [Sanguibacteroides justesenii]MCR9013097.1 DUF4136 domain-containing protein [Gabonibacter chumensis]PXZ42931.1 DUF4136 domain-containing protein [Sanguibacteroides justesenii]